MKNSLALFWKRLLAFALDYIIISAYLVVLVILGVVIARTPARPRVSRALRRPELRRGDRIPAACRASAALFRHLRVVPPGRRPGASAC